MREVAAMRVVKINDIKDQVEELVTRVEAGETILIEKDGRTVARIERVDKPTLVAKEGFDFEALRKFTDSLPPAKETAADLIRRMRDESY
jgi:antitoxin (DNA-binding transcriptional repressor) of toxin-antitoxin stability system